LAVPPNSVTVHHSKRLRTLPSADQTLSAVTRLARSRAVGYAVEGISRDTLIRIVDHPELALRIHTRDTIKAGRSALLVRGEIPIGGRVVAVAYKRVQRNGSLKRLTAWLTGNRTLRTWRMGRLFDRLNIATAEPLLVVVPRWYAPAEPSYLIHEWLDQADNIKAYADRLESASSYESRHRLNAAARRLGEVLGRMHAARISHRDLKAGNLMLKDCESSVEAFVIDLDGARRFPWRPRFRKARDLSRLALAVSQIPSMRFTIALRFLMAYLRAAGIERADWKPLWREIAKMADQRKRQKQRRPSR